MDGSQQNDLARGLLNNAGNSDGTALFGKKCRGSSVKFAKLDALRGFAALYVVMGHAAFSIGTKPWLLGFGQEAVIIFFLLSGFVIKVATETGKGPGFRDFFVKRSRRIYPVIFATFFISFIVQLLNTGSTQISWTSLLGNIFMLQDLGVIKPGNWLNPFLENAPLWSLSYEWYFYMLFFPLNLLVKESSHRIYIMLSISLVAWASFFAYFNHASLVLSYWILWWAGAESAAIFLKHNTFTLANMKHVIIALTIMTLATAIPLLFYKFQGFGFFPFLFFRHFAMATVFIILGLVWWQRKLVGFQFFPGPFAGLAIISYSLYTIHYPILVLLKIPGDQTLIMVFRLLIILVLAYLLEVKMQPLINRHIR